jgi:hypothetical protein
MNVNVIKRTNGGWNIEIVEIEIADTCPQCGGKRGEPYWHQFHEDGDWYSCQRWDNPCGHLDMYRDVLKEAYGR